MKLRDNKSKKIKRQKIIYKHNLIYMRNFYTMKNLVKGLMLSAVMTLGVATASAQETNGGADDTKYEPVAANKFWMGEVPRQETSISTT